MAQFNFNTQDAPKREANFELLPAGWYNAQIVESEIVPLAKTPGGSALKMTFEILSDGYRGRKVWVRLNVRHPGSAEAERISQEQLRELCESIGVSRMQDTVELHNKPVQVKVKVRKSTDPQYEDQNEITAYKALAQGGAAPGGFPGRTAAANAPVAPPAQAPAQAPAAAPAANTPPWVKRAG